MTVKKIGFAIVLPFSAFPKGFEARDWIVWRVQSSSLAANYLAPTAVRAALREEHVLLALWDAGALLLRVRGVTVGVELAHGVSV
jgi:hypothetical protein